VDADLSALHASRWSVEKASGWQSRLSGARGCNYVPRHCVNTTQMWQQFDQEIIDEELGWGHDIGLNSLRVFVQYLVYESEPSQLLDAVSRLLDIAARHGMTVMFALLDDCWGPEPTLGAQPAPLPGVHNSRWTSSPGEMRRQPEHWPDLERYVKGLLGRFASDERVIAWDLYNEAGPASRPLVEAAFAWSREVGPSQPLTSCWEADDLVDVVTFHCYTDPEKPGFHQALQAGTKSGRPVACTECLARTYGNTLEKILPAFGAAQIGWYVWGLVSGATQTRFPWRWPVGGPEPCLWFHDLLYPDGRPYRPEEVDLLRAYAAMAESRAGCQDDRETD